MLLSYAGYLQMFKRKDTLDTFDDFILRCLKRDLLPVERQNVTWLYKSYRFSNDYRMEVDNGHEG